MYSSVSGSGPNSPKSLVVFPSSVSCLVASGSKISTYSQVISREIGTNTQREKYYK
jgi:hypothetical protein